MIDWLVKKFIKDPENWEDPAVRERYGLLTGLVGIVLNLLLSAGKLGAAFVRDGALTAQERGLVFGRVMEGRPHSELAQIYGQSAATLRKRYERARGKLARALTELSDTEKEVSP